MPPRPWAGPVWTRPFRRLSGSLERYAPPEGDARPMLLRRVLLLALIFAGAAIGTWAMLDVLPERGKTLSEQVLLGLFAILFAWILAGFWTGVLGAWALATGGRRHGVRHELATTPDVIDPASRTAVIMPIYNEQVSSVFGGLQATVESLARTPHGERFDFFVLSDTGNPQIRAAEQAAWTQLTTDLRERGIGVNVYYRWRQHRTRRKTGNVADFCRRWGAHYKYMIVLDADSVMTGSCLTGLTRLMENHPDVGIIQTAPQASGHDSVHARVQQFGSRVFGPLFTAGLRYWQLGESHYWGHNAILRIQPFMKHCALAPLPGKGAMSGDVMSHDFVEAALMRRAGYKVWIAPDLPGSYEQVPPNLITEVQRDQRWCHGNLQNSRLTFEPGLHPVHRTVFVTGVLAYLSAPLWLAFLLASTWLFAQNAQAVPQYFVESFQLFPVWPTVNVKLMLTLFGTTAFLLLAPKALSLLLLIVSRQTRGYGGSLRLLASAVLEFFYSMLLAPVRMLFHTQFVLAALTGLKLDWKSPPREDSSTSWGEAVRRHGLHTLLAVAWVIVIVRTSGTFAWWLSPVILGILLSIPMSVYGSRPGPGRWLRRHRIFLTPEEYSAPAELVDATRYASQYADTIDLQRIADDGALARQISLAGPQPARSRGDKAVARAQLVQRAAAQGADGLQAPDQHRLLSDPDAMQAWRERVRPPGAPSDPGRPARTERAGKSPVAVGFDRQHA